MKKLVLVAALFLSAPWLNAMADTMTCPTSITCNYDAGTCENIPPGWVVDGDEAGVHYDGSQTVQISNIFASKKESNGSINNSWVISCFYQYATVPYVAGLRLYTTVSLLSGSNWSYSGFGKHNAVCANPRLPEVCTGENELR